VRDEKIGVIVVVILFALMFLFYISLIQLELLVDFSVYKDAIIENNEYAFALPLAFFLGQFFYGVIRNELVLYGGAFLFFIATILIVMWLYREFNVRLRWLPLQFLMFLPWIHFCFIWGRDVLFIFSSTLFFAIIILGHYNKIPKGKLYYSLIGFSLLFSFLNKSISLMLFLFFLIYFFITHRKKVLAFFPSLFPTQETLMQLYDYYSWLIQIQPFRNAFDLWGLLFFLVNPVYFLLATLILTIRKHRLFVFIFAWIVLSSFLLYSFEGWVIKGNFGDFYRYGFYLMPTAVFLNGFALSRLRSTHLELFLFCMALMGTFLVIGFFEIGRELGLLGLV